MTATTNPNLTVHNLRFFFKFKFSRYRRCLMHFLTFSCGNVKLWGRVYNGRSNLFQFRSSAGWFSSPLAAWSLAICSFKQDLRVYTRRQPSKGHWNISAAVRFLWICSEGKVSWFVDALCDFDFVVRWSLTCFAMRCLESRVDLWNLELYFRTHFVFVLTQNHVGQFLA